MDFITWCSASKSCVSAKGTEIAPMMSIMSLYHKSKYIYIYIYCGWLCFWHVHIGIVCIKCELSDPLTTKSCRRQTQEAGKNLDQRHQRLNHLVPCRLIISVAVAAMAMNVVQNPASRLEVKCLASVSNPMEPMARNSSENNEHGCRPRVPTSCPYWPLLTHGNG